MGNSRFCRESAALKNNHQPLITMRRRATQISMATLARSLTHGTLLLSGILTWGSLGLSAPAEREHGEETSAAKRFRRDWTLSFEGVTHAPVDLGLQLGLETPQRIRLFGGYGWVPDAYMNLLTGVAASASGNAYAQALLNEARYDGHTWRVQVGWRPFRALGLYGDVGYARLSAKGSLDLASSGVPMLESLGGGYEATTHLDLWLFELGYQARFGDRLLMAFGLGAMGTFNAQSRISAVGGAPRSNAILGQAAAQGDDALEKYGIVPTLTLRIGFDLI
jgi:hypothetical protein